MKKLISLVLFSLSTSFAVADDHASGPLFYGQSFGFVADNPAAVVAAMDKWRSSDVGKATPNTVVLLQNLVNGDYKSTHQVNVFYANTAAMDESAKAVANDRGWRTFQSSMQKLTEPEWENTYAILRAKVSEGDITSANPVSIVYSLTVTDAPAFMSAFNQMWGSAAIQNFPGAVYFGQNIASGPIPGTHFITFVADSRGKLMEAVTKMQASEQMAAYLSQIGDTRKLEQTSMTVEAKRWAN